MVHARIYATLLVIASLPATALLFRKTRSQEDLERDRREALVKMGRITDGTVIETQELPADASGFESQFIVYTYDVGGVTYHAFVWQNGQKTDLGPGEAKAINGLGQIVGLNGVSATLWKNGQAIDLNTQISSNSGWNLKTATGVNDHGQIVGAGIRGGSLRAFLLTPR